MFDDSLKGGHLSRMLSSGYNAPTRENFPLLLFSVDANKVFPGAGITGYAQDYISGARWYGSSYNSGGPKLATWQKDVATGQFWRGTDHGSTEADQSPDMANFPDAWGDKNLLMIWVGEQNNDYHGIGDVAGSPILGASFAGEGDCGISAGTEGVTQGALDPFVSNFKSCVCSVFNRGAATDALASATYRTDDGLTIKNIISSAVKTGGTATSMLTASWPAPAARFFIDNGNLNSGSLYGIYLLGFSNANRKYMDIARLGPIIRWMYRNPTKGLHPFFFGMGRSYQ